MKINNHDPIKDLSAYIQDIKEAQKDRVKDKTALKEAGNVDKVQISSKAKVVQKLRKEIDLLPDVRTKKVEEAKMAVESGTYNVRGEKVASKIIGESVIDSIL